MRMFEMRRLKHVVELQRIRANVVEGPYVGLENIESWTGRLKVTPDTQTLSEDAIDDSAGQSQMNSFQPGDILFGKLRPYLAKAWVADCVGRCTTEALVMRAERVEPRFLLHVLLQPSFVDAVDSSTYGSKMPRAEWDFIGSVPIPVPPRAAQRAIVDLLDRETARIDALVAAKQRLLDLLAEKRKAIIATAVTRGLDPKVKLRDSGVPWLGEIPAHWEVVPIRYLLDLGPKNGISPQQSGADGALSFSISAVRDGRVTIEGNEKLVALEPLVARGYYLKPSDILLVRGNGNLSLVGTCGLLEVVPDECTYPDILMLMRVGERIISELLVSAINSPYVRQQIESLAQTTNGTYKLSGEDVRTLQIALPPLDEQRAIVAHIARETAKLDAVRVATERTIALLKERRSALIAAAVTGQLDLRATA